jgi:antitoxin HicB
VAHTKTPTPGWLKVSDRVVSNAPGIDWRGVVVEDRGPLAINGSQIVAIQLDYAPDAPQFEVHAEELELVSAKGAEREFDVVMVAEPEGGYSVLVPELPSVATQGETVEEARTNAREAIEGYLEVMHTNGLPIPKVRGDRVAVRSV